MRAQLGAFVWCRSLHSAFSGDQITGENTFKENSTSYLSQVFGPVSSRKIPFSSTYGNVRISCSRRRRTRSLTIFKLTLSIISGHQHDNDVSHRFHLSTHPPITDTLFKGEYKPRPLTSLRAQPLLRPLLHPIRSWRPQLWSRKLLGSNLLRPLLRRS